MRQSGPSITGHDLRLAYRQYRESLGPLGALIPDSEAAKKLKTLYEDHLADDFSVSYATFSKIYSIIREANDSTGSWWSRSAVGFNMLLGKLGIYQPIFEQDIFSSTDAERLCRIIESIGTVFIQNAGPLPLLISLSNDRDLGPDYSRPIKFLIKYAHDFLGQDIETATTIAKLIIKCSFSRYLSEERLDRGDNFCSPLNKLFLECTNKPSSVVITALTRLGNAIATRTVETTFIAVLDEIHRSPDRVSRVLHFGESYTPPSIRHPARTEVSAAAGIGGGPRLFQAPPTIAVSAASSAPTNQERFTCIKNQLAKLEAQFADLAKSTPHPTAVDEAIATITKLKASLSKFEEKPLYQCRIMNELLNKGLTLPSGNTVDESSLVQHLNQTITGKTDPFTRTAWDLNLTNYKSKVPESRDINTAINEKLTKFEKQLGQLSTLLSEIDPSPLATVSPAR